MIIQLFFKGWISLDNLICIVIFVKMVRNMFILQCIWIIIELINGKLSIIVLFQKNPQVNGMKSKGSILDDRYHYASVVMTWGRGSLGNGRPRGWEGCIPTHPGPWYHLLLLKICKFIKVSILFIFTGRTNTTKIVLLVVKGNCEVLKSCPWYISRLNAYLGINPKPRFVL